MSYILHAVLYGCAMGAVYGLCIGGYTEFKKYIEKRKTRDTRSYYKLLNTKHKEVLMTFKKPTLIIIALLIVFVGYIGIHRIIYNKDYATISSLTEDIYKFISAL